MAAVKTVVEAVAARQVEDHRDRDRGAGDDAGSGSSASASWRVSGVAVSSSAASSPEMWPTSVDIPVAVTTNWPVPRVAFVFMKTMSLRSPSGDVVAGDRSTPFDDRHALAGQRRLGDLERRGLEQAPVGRDDVSRLDRDDVAGDELVGRDLSELAVAADLRLDDHHLLQRRDGRGGLALLVQPEHGVEDGEQQQDDPRAVLPERDDAADARRPAARSASGRSTAGRTRASAARSSPRRTVRARTSPREPQPLRR